MQKGQSLVELLIAIGLSALFLPALLTSLVTSREGKAQQNQRIEAVSLLKEEQEVVRSVREKDWNTFAVNGTFHPVILGSSWNLSAGQETVAGFTREIVISSVFRDTNGTIVASGGSADPSTKKVVIRVSWNTPFPSSVSSTTYLTRHLNNTTFVQTTSNDFDTGTKTGVTVTNTNGGEVVLGAGGQGNWCEPNLSIAALDLPKQGVVNAITAIEGKVFAGTGENASGVSFANVSISNTDPPVASIIGTTDGYKTNGLFGEQNYVYIATDTNAKEIAILDIGSLPYNEVGHFDSPGPTDANNIFVVGNTGYMTAGNKLYNFDLTHKNGARQEIDPDGLTLAGTGTKIMIVGNYAYIAIAGATTKMQIIDISNPSNLTTVGQASVAGSDGQDIFVNTTGTRAYLVTSASPTQKELFIIDVSTKVGERPVIGSYDTNGMSPKGIIAVPGNRAIIVGTDGEEYQVVDIANETNPTRCGGLQIDTGVNGVAGVLEGDGDAFSYIITGDVDSELKIIEGGPGGQYVTQGIFESSLFDPGFPVTFNWLNVTYSKSALTDIKFQIAIAAATGGSCTGVNFTYVGPDGITSSYFTADAAIPLNDDGVGFENPGRCFRYKAYLTTSDITLSPVLNDITINYSP